MVSRIADPVKEYGLAIGTTLLATVARFLLDPVLGNQFPYSIFFIAAAITTFHTGLGASLTAVILGGRAADYFFMSPRQSFVLGGIENYVGMGTYCIAALAIVGFGQALRRARQRAETLTEEYRREAGDRIRAEAGQRESETRFRLVADTAPVFMWMSDTTKLCTWFNKAWLEFTGRRIEQEVGDGWSELIHPDDVEGCLGTYTRCSDARIPFKMEYRMRRHDGEYRWLMGNGIPRCGADGEFLGYIGSCIDITDRKQGEIQLLASEERFRTMADHISQFAWMADATGWINWYNRRWYEYTGTTLADMQGWGWEKVHHPDHRDRVVTKWKQAHLTGEPWEDTFPLRGKDGQYRWFLSRALPILDGAGAIVRWFGTNTDITEQQAAEEALRRSQETLRGSAELLEHTVRKRTNELMQSQEQLRALATELNLAEHRERQRLATELHDHLAQMLVLGKLKLSQTKQLPGLSSACQSLVQDIEEVLTKSLTYTRTLVADLAPPVLHEFGLLAALPWLAEQMRQYELEVHLTVPDTHDLTLPEDQAVLIFQSVRELLMNVGKHAGAREASLCLESENGELCLEVRDTGAGFDTTSMIGATLTARSPGFGLFSIRERMLALGGRFELTSVPGQGTTARLMLPLMPGTTSEGRGITALRHGVSTVATNRLTHVPSNFIRPLPATHAHATIRVIVADDHAMVRQGLRGVLDAYADIQVVGEASNGKEAVDLTRRVGPDIVLMDVNMPQMDGLEATRRIKDEFPAVLVIGLSVQNAEHVEAAMKEAGAVAFLNKEAAVEELQQTILTVWKNSQQPD